MPIKIKEENKGKFTEWAKEEGKSACGAANMVMKNKGAYSSKIIKRANFAKNFGCSS